MATVLGTMNPGAFGGGMPATGKHLMASKLAGFKKLGRLKRTRLKPRIPPKAKLGLD